jgi:hypothetical protein
MEGQMATRIVKLTGIAEWAKVFEDNRDMRGFEGAFEAHNGACTIDLIMDDDNMMKLKASRSIKKGKPDFDGRGTRVKFVRKWEERFGGGSPVVTKDDDTVWELGSDGFIGNGSLVEVTLAVYDTSRKAIVGTRLDKVKILDAIEYRLGEEDTTPTPTAPTPVTAKASPELVEDDVLF